MFHYITFGTHQTRSKEPKLNQFEITQTLIMGLVVCPYVTLKPQQDLLECSVWRPGARVTQIKLLYSLHRKLHTLQTPESRLMHSLSIVSLLLGVNWGENEVLASLSPYPPLSIHLIFIQPVH